MPILAFLICYPLGRRIGGNSAWLVTCGFYFMKTLTIGIDLKHNTQPFCDFADFLFNAAYADFGRSFRNHPAVLRAAFLEGEPRAFTFEVREPHRMADW